MVQPELQSHLPGRWATSPGPIVCRPAVRVRGFFYVHKEQGK